MLAQAHSMGPVTRAIAAMRDGHLDNAVHRLLAEPDPRPAPAPNPLAALSIGGLYSLFDAYEAASYAFTYEANTPRAEGDRNCARMLDDLADAHGHTMGVIVDEMKVRTPSGSWERGMRLKLLMRWSAGAEDWPAVERLLTEARTVEA